MEQQQANALKVMDFLRSHRKVTGCAYPGVPVMGDAQVALHRRQCSGSGSLISFFIPGGEREAFAVLDRIRLSKLAVSLGGIESLIELPYTMTHADMTAEEKARAGITESMIRLSVGLEDSDDIIEDLRQALAILD